MSRATSNAGAAILFFGLCPASTAFAQEGAAPPVSLQGRYVGDVVHVAQGVGDAQTYLVHDAELNIGFDLERLAGVAGLSAGAHVLATAGGTPNDAAGTLQGVENIEVASHRVKLYEAWLEQAIGSRASLRLGLTDLNADFYQNDSAGLLIAPAFGIGSELAATGPNGPSIFPSTALTARLSTQLGEAGYARVAVVDAKSGVIGDPGGIDFSMRHGALLIAEAGTTRGGKVALGVWRYTERQDDIRAVDANGAPLGRIANGAYLLVDQKVAGDDTRAANLFLRVGISDGKTTPFRGGFQAGVLLSAPFSGRPDGNLSFGIQQGLLARGYRAALADTGTRTAPAEWGLELTYADKLAPFLTVQPDVQYVRRAFSEGGSRNTLVFGMRFILAASHP